MFTSCYRASTFTITLIIQIITGGKKKVRRLMYKCDIIYYYELYIITY